jgi:hypothetical protein
MTLELAATASRRGKDPVGTMVEGKPLDTSAHHDAVMEIGSLRQRQPHHVSVAIAPSSRITDRSLHPADAPNTLGANRPMTEEGLQLADKACPCFDARQVWQSSVLTLPIIEEDMEEDKVVQAAE